jgi:hypothetical protein
VTGRVCQPSLLFSHCSGLFVSAKASSTIFLAARASRRTARIPPHHLFPTPCPFRASAAHPRLRIGWRIAVPWVSPQGCVGLCQPRQPVRTIAGPQGRHPGSRLWAMKRRIPRRAQSEKGASGANQATAVGGTTQFEAIGQGGRGKGGIRCSWIDGAVELASQCRRDISTIFQPTSLTPHSHRRPPFLDTH